MHILALGVNIYQILGVRYVIEYIKQTFWFTEGIVLQSDGLNHILKD